MQTVWNNMISVFESYKSAGSYFALFLISLAVIYNTDRQKNRYYVLFATGILLLLICNPLTVWIFSMLFPVLSSYRPFLLWVPTLLFIPFAGVEMLETIKTTKTRMLGLIGLVLLITVAGNQFGIYLTPTEEKNRMEVTKEQKQMIQELEQETDAVILADETIAPFMRTESDEINLLYGKDLWIADLDLGIVDGYAEDMMSIFEAMKNPEECLNDITSMAAMYECDIIVVRKYEGYPKKSGNYQLLKDTNHYLLYGLQ